MTVTSAETSHIEAPEPAGQHSDSDAAGFIATGIGPRQVNGRYYSGYWGNEYTVTAIDRDIATGTWSITVATDAEAVLRQSRTHCTPWDHRRDRVVAQPTAAPQPTPAAWTPSRPGNPPGDRSAQQG